MIVGSGPAADPNGRIDSAPRYTSELEKSLPRFDRSVSMLFWGYNEEMLVGDALRRAHELLERCVEDFEIIIVDDGSTDRTGEIIRELARRYPRIRLLQNETNMNVAFSAWRAMQAAEKEYLFWQTIDWSYDISHLRLYLELLKSHDIVAGTRSAPVDVQLRLLKPFAGILRLFHVKHITKRSDTVWKAVVSVLNYSLVRLLFNLPVSDYQNVVFYPTRLIRSVNKEANSSFAGPEFLMKLYWRGHSMVEVPISFIPRSAGKAKGTKIRSIALSVRDVFKYWLKWVVFRQRTFERKGKIVRYRAEEWDL